MRCRYMTCLRVETRDEEKVTREWLNAKSSPRAVESSPLKEAATHSHRERERRRGSVAIRGRNAWVSLMAWNAVLGRTLIGFRAN